MHLNEAGVKAVIPLNNKEQWGNLKKMRKSSFAGKLILCSMEDGVFNLMTLCFGYDRKK